MQVAKKPNIDSLAAQGRCGFFKSIPDNFATGSAVANLSILGYDPHQYFHGRGVLEAASMGVELKGNDVALRCNTICVENGFIKNHSAGQISTEEATVLIKELNSKLGTSEIKFYPGVSYRHLLVLKNSCSPDVVCFAPHDHLSEPLESLFPET